MSVPAGRWTLRHPRDARARRGFSTKRETDRESGRGVGMAVVKETIEQLSGTIDARHRARPRHALHHPVCPSRSPSPTR